MQKDTNNNFTFHAINIDHERGNCRRKLHSHFS